MFTTKRKLREQIEQLKLELNCAKGIRDEVVKYNEQLADTLNKMLTTFPFYLGQVVYEVKLRSDKGRYTKSKASKEHSSVVEVVVTTDNYFKLLDKYNNQMVYIENQHAEQYIASVSVN